MHKEVISYMEARLMLLRDRMMSIVPFDLTHDECLELIADPEHISILKHAAQYAHITAAHEWMNVRPPMCIDGADSFVAQLKMRTHGEIEPPLSPRNTCWNPGKIGGAKVAAWLEARLALGRRAGLAFYTLRQLAALCDTGAQVRYAWPAVMQLAVGSDNVRTISWAEKNATYKPQRFMPIISPTLKMAIRESSALITSAALLGEEHREVTFEQVQINVWAMPSFECLGVSISRL